MKKYPNSLDSLKEIVYELLEDFGFTEDLYYVRENTESIMVEFDDIGAVNYIIQEVEKTKYKDFVFVNYLKKGKRHVAIFSIMQ